MLLRNIHIHTQVLHVLCFFLGCVLFTSCIKGRVVVRSSGDTANSNPTGVSTSNTSFSDTQNQPAILLSDVPTGESRITDLYVTVSGNHMSHYRYKLGSSSAIECRQQEGYGDESEIDQPIIHDISSLPDGDVTLCVIAKNTSGVWLSHAESVTASWVKDTEAPVAVLLGALSDVSSQITYSVTVSGEGVVSYRYKTGLSAVTDCAETAGYSDSINSAAPITDDLSMLADAAMRLCVIAGDTAGNWQESVYATVAEWTKDVTPPGNFTITAPSSFVTTSTPTVTWSEADGADLYVISIADDDDCEAPFVQQHTNITTTSLVLNNLNEGIYYVCVSAMDASGNATVATNQEGYSFVVDTLDPVIQISTFALPQRAGSVTLHWSLTEANAGSADTATIEISSNDVTWTTLATPALGEDGPLNDQMMSTSVTLPMWDVSTARIRIRYTDAAGLEGSAVSDVFIIDNTPPQVTALEINDGDATANSNYLRANLTAEETDPLNSSMISHVCLRYLNSDQPSIGDSCWVPVTPTLNLSLSNFYFRVGFTPGPYTVYAFVKDQAGNISTISGNGNGTDGVDRRTIGVFPGKPPVVSRVSATGVAAPDHPPSIAQLQVPLESTVYIKWKATDEEGLGATPISLSYTTDGTTFTEIANNLLNGSNSGCTIDDPGTTWDDEATGCYVWTNASPTSSYYRIRVTAIDTDSMISFAQSDALNLTQLRFIAGNTESGLGGSATSAIFHTGAADSRAQRLAVLPSGRIFVLDNRGLITVDPIDGVQRLLIPTLGAVSGFGDGGPAHLARLYAPHRIALTYDGNILITDYDRIRIIDTSASPMTIDTLIGGGDQTSDGVNARDLQITAQNFSYSSLIPLPNGDVLFQRRAFYNAHATGDLSIERYIAATGNISSTIISGTSDFIRDQQANLSYCWSRSIGAAANTSTGELTKLVVMLGGMEGGLCPRSTGNEHSFSASLNPVSFSADNQNPGYLHYNAANPYWRDFYYDYVSGLDGNLYAFSMFAANSTRVHKYNHESGVWDLLINRSLGECDDGVSATSCSMKLHSMFVDAQGKFYFIDAGTVRTIQDDGTMLTLVGQKDSYGEGLATDARFAVIGGFDIWADDDLTKVVLSDASNYRIREFVIGGDIQTLAGTGTKSQPSANTPAVNQPVAWGGDTINAYLSLDTSGNIFTHRQVGTLGILNRSTGLWSNLTTGFISYGPLVLGRSSTKLLVGDFTNSAGHNPELWEVVIDTGVRTKIAAYVGASGDFCEDGSSLMDCIMPYYSSTRVSFGGWDSVDQQWYLKYLNAGNSKRIVTLKGGVMGTLTTLQYSSSTFAYRYNGDKSINIVYYCGTDGFIYKHDVNQPLDNDVLMPYSVPGMLCTRTNGQMLYDATRDRLMFTYVLNNLPGIAEFLNP